MRNFHSLSSLIFKTKSSFSTKGRTVCLFFGVPGSGIGTFNSLLCEEFGLNRISLTEELRKIKEGNDYHIFRPEIVDRIRNSLLIGRTIEEAYFGVLESKMSEEKSAKGVSIDGFPRSWKQFEMFEKKYSIDLAIHLVVEKCILVEGMLGRRVCKKCHKSYNLCHIERHGYCLMPILPKKNGVCDVCGSNLISKAEDNMQTIITRIDRYQKNTEQMVDHLYKNYKVFEFMPKKGVEDFQILKNGVKNTLSFI